MIPGSVGSTSFPEPKMSVLQWGAKDMDGKARGFGGFTLNGLNDATTELNLLVDAEIVAVEQNRATYAGEWNINESAECEDGTTAILKKVTYTAPTGLRQPFTNLQAHWDPVVPCS